MGLFRDVERFQPNRSVVIWMHLRLALFRHYWQTSPALKALCLNSKRARAEAKRPAV